MSIARNDLPQTVTLYASEEEEEGLKRVEIPLQEKFTGTSRVIPNSLANTSCAEFGIDGLLQLLNEIHGTSYFISAPPEDIVDETIFEDDGDSDEWSDEDEDSSPAAILSFMLSQFVHRRTDFGLAYARLRPWWHLLTSPTSVQENMSICEMDDGSLRENALSQWSHQTAPTIHPPDSPPRRVWDLFANRVVPMYVVSQMGARGEHPNGEYSSMIVGISHSWARPEERKDVRTPINAFEWPVPIPADTSLERVRIELLNLGLEYVWLDVLCLRQASFDAFGEQLRKDEWKLDVPTIGNVYRAGERVVHYYSGLGRRFTIGDMRDERHWLNRAWTLQEISPNSIVAGITPSSPSIPSFDSSGAIHVPNTLDEPAKAFFTNLATLHAISARAPHIYPVLSSMRHRACTSELDKICGLAYLLRSKRLPPYIVEENVEAAWARFLETISPSYKGDLLFLFPEAGEGTYKWAPSWEQVKSAASLPACESIELQEEVHYDSSWHIYRHHGYHLDDVRVEGLEHSPTDGEERTGSLTILDNTGTEHQFPILASHEQPIPDGQYILHGSQNYQFWVVGKIVPIVPLTREKGTIEKVSVVRLDKATAQELQTLAIAELRESGFV